MILPALTQGGYSFETQVHVGQRLGGGRHMVDVLAQKDAHRYLISLKWQQVGGTAEQKVPFEVICLLDAVQAGDFAKAYVVLGGDGWSLRDFYTSGGLNRYIPEADCVEVLTLERFIARANDGQL